MKVHVLINTKGILLDFSQFEIESEGIDGIEGLVPTLTAIEDEILPVHLVQLTHLPL